MRSVTETFNKSQLKAISFLLNSTEYKYPQKYSAVLEFLKLQGFLAIKQGKKYILVADPDYKGDCLDE